jgi:hypothetical protein
VNEDELLAAGFRPARKSDFDRWDRGWWFTRRSGVDADGEVAKPWTVLVRMWDFPSLRPDLPGLEVGWDCELYLKVGASPDGPNGSVRVTASCREASPAAVIDWAEKVWGDFQSPKAT